MFSACSSHMLVAFRELQPNHNNKQGSLFLLRRRRHLLKRSFAFAYDEVNAAQQQLCAGKLCRLSAAACFLAAGHSLAASSAGESTGKQAAGKLAYMKQSTPTNSIPYLLQDAVDT